MEQLARLRELKGFSQRALAKESGVSPATIYELENGRRRPNPSTLRKLAIALGVEVVDLLGADYPKEARRSSSEPTLFNGAIEAERRVPSVILDALSSAAENLAHTPPPQSLFEVGQQMGMVTAINGVRTPLLAFIADAGEWVELFSSEEAERLVNVTIELLEATKHVLKQTNEFLEREKLEAVDVRERLEAEEARQHVRELTERISA